MRCRVLCAQLLLWKRTTANASSLSLAEGAHVYDPLDVDDLLYRLEADIMCDSWNWPAVVCQWVVGFIMCTGAMTVVVVGSMTYLSVCRPRPTRSSVAASQRSCQMLFAAISLSIGGDLFDSIGPGWMHCVLAIGSSLFISTLCFFKMRASRIVSFMILCDF